MYCTISASSGAAADEAPANTRKRDLYEYQYQKTGARTISASRGAAAEEAPAPQVEGFKLMYRVTSLIRKRHPLGPCSRHMRRALWRY